MLLLMHSEPEQEEGLTKNHSSDQKTLFLLCQPVNEILIREENNAMNANT